MQSIQLRHKVRSSRACFMHHNGPIRGKLQDRILACPNVRMRDRAISMGNSTSHLMLHIFFMYGPMFSIAD